MRSVVRSAKVKRIGVYNAPSNAIHPNCTNFIHNTNPITAPNPFNQGRKQTRTQDGEKTIPHIRTQPSLSRNFGLFSFSPTPPLPSTRVIVLLCVRGGAESGPDSLLVTESPKVLRRGSKARRELGRTGDVRLVMGMLARLGEAPAGRPRRGMNVSGADPRRPAEGSTIGGGRRSTELSMARRGRMFGRKAVY
jgi:hypothetical protein